MKSGTILLIGRPNVGKSTFLNNLLQQKVAITSPKPQTTRFPIKAVYEDERGKIVFTDTPGIFGKVQDFLSKKINQRTLETINEGVDLIIYMVDHTRKRDFEESKVLGIVRKLTPHKILVVNKIDLEEPSYLPQYKFMEEEFPDVFYISSLLRKHMGPLLNRIYELLPERDNLNLPEQTAYPILNIDSYTFIGELIREKVFLQMGEEIPYTTTAIVDQIIERKGNLTYIQARILTTADRYKRMIIGVGGRKIKEMGSMARKEIELATKRKIYLDLTVEVDARWQEKYYS